MFYFSILLNAYSHAIYLCLYQNWITGIYSTEAYASTRKNFVFRNFCKRLNLLKQAFLQVPSVSALQRFGCVVLSYEHYLRKPVMIYESYLVVSRSGYVIVGIQKLSRQVETLSKLTNFVG